MCASLVPERLDGFYFYSVFYSLSIIGRCLANMNEQSNSKNKGPQHIIAIISKRAVTVLFKTIGLNQTAGEHNGTPSSGLRAKCNLILNGVIDFG
jgi:hypothetical protein